VNSEIHWWPPSSMFRDALGRRNQETLEMHLEAMVERVSRCTWRWLIRRWYIRRKSRREAENLFSGQTHHRGNVAS
jgi:hypothetical protein